MMHDERTERELRDPRHPANRRLVWRASACICLGVVCAISGLVVTRAFLPLWVLACALFIAGAVLSERYRLRVRPLTPFELLRAVLLVVAITLVLGLALPPLLIWFFDTFAISR